MTSCRLINETNRKLTDQIKAFAPSLGQRTWFCYAVNPAFRIICSWKRTNIIFTLRKSKPARRTAPDPAAGDGSARRTDYAARREYHRADFRAEAMWVDQSYREEAMFRGYTVVDPATVVTTHITEVVKIICLNCCLTPKPRNSLMNWIRNTRSLSKGLFRAKVSLGAVQRILQNLLQERVSIRDLPTILEGISEAVASTHSLMTITEHVRTRLARRLSNANANELGIIPW